MSDFLDPLRLDRDLRTLARRWQRWRQNPSADGFDTARLTRKQRLDALRALPDSDPLAPYLARWMYRLLEQRVNSEAEFVVAQTARELTHEVERPEHGRFTHRELLGRAFSDAARRSDWCSSLLGCSELVSQRVGDLWERRQEVAVRAGLTSPDEYELPGMDLHESALAWLDATRDAAHELSPRELGGYLDSALGTEASAGWPSRLSPRTLADWFRDTRLLDSLELSLPQLPEPVGSASYLRGLWQLGVAFREAAAPRHQPFVVAHDPYALESHAHGALFCLLPLNLPFARRALGLSSAQLIDHRRVLARVVLLGSRWLSLRVRLRRPALAGRAALSRAFVEETERLGIELPAHAAGAIGRLRITDSQRLAGLFLAAARQRMLTEAHDEDWYRNPRAIEQLRAEADLSPSTRVEPELINSEMMGLRRWLLEALG